MIFYSLFFLHIIYLYNPALYHLIFLDFMFIFPTSRNASTYRPSLFCCQNQPCPCWCLRQHFVLPAPAMAGGAHWQFHYRHVRQPGEFPAALRYTSQAAQPLRPARPRSPHRPELVGLLCQSPAPFRLWCNLRRRQPRQPVQPALCVIQALPAIPARHAGKSPA